MEGSKSPQTTPVSGTIPKNIGKWPGLYCDIL